MIHYLVGALICQFSALDMAMALGSKFKYEHDTI